jgi:hypothetical protein
MSILAEILSFDGSLRQSVDLETGEILHSEADAKCVRTGREEARNAQSGREALSTCHIPPQIILCKGASVITAKRTSVPKETSLLGEDDKPKEKRGKIGGFSPKSANRLRRLVNSVRTDFIPLFVTLTYPSEFPDKRENFKRDLDVFIKRLVRKFPDVAGVTKLEPQGRGAPHFHLLVWRVSLRDLREFVPLAWHEVVKKRQVCPDVHLLFHEGLLGNEHCVQELKSRGGVNWYISKYMSKTVAAECDDWGRWWGVFGRERLPFGETIIVQVTEQKAIEFIRYMRRYGRIRSRDYRSLTVICNSDFWAAKLL